MGLEITRAAVLRPEEPDDFFLACSDGELREVHAISTHVSNQTVLIETLGHHHGLGNGEAELAGGLLL